MRDNSRRLDWTGTAQPWTLRASREVLRMPERYPPRVVAEAAGSDATQGDPSNPDEDAVATQGDPSDPKEEAVGTRRRATPNDIHGAFLAGHDPARSSLTLLLISLTVKRAPVEGRSVIRALTLA